MTIAKPVSDSAAAREASTPPLLLWNEALRFAAGAGVLSAAGRAPHEPLYYRCQALYLACHGIELALKSHLRAKEFSLRRLINIGHSLTKALERSIGTGMEPPPAEILHRIRFLSAAHEEHVFRYAHLHRPPHMDRADWIVVTTWSLRTAIPAVALSSGCAQERMQRDVTQLRFPSAIWNDETKTFTLIERE
jgi:hypothetical protein